jgi:multiple sugar transport system permease protein
MEDLNLLAKTNSEKKEAITFYVLISPWLIHFFLFALGPMLASLYFGFTKWDMLNPPQWIGLDNFKFALFEDPLFWKSLRITVTYAIFSVPLTLIFGLALAMLLNKAVRGVSIFRTLFYLPSQLSGVAVMILWMFIYNPQIGLLNTILSYFGIEGPGWIFDPNWSLPSLILMSLWEVGGGMIIWLAGLKGIPDSLYEAAELDGASPWRQFCNVTLPMLSPTIFFTLVMGIISALQKFGEAFVMTKGGPLNSTRLYNFHLYDYAFSRMEMGYASALAWLLFVIIMALTLIVFKSSASWVHYDGERK